MKVLRIKLHAIVSITEYYCDSFLTSFSFALFFNPKITLRNDGDSGFVFET